MFKRFKQTFCRSRKERAHQLEHEEHELQQFHVHKSASVPFSALTSSNLSTKRSNFTAKDMLAVSTSMAATSGNNASLYTNTTIQQATPVLFSTNRGLHLRMQSNCNGINPTNSNNKSNNNDSTNSCDIVNGIVANTALTATATNNTSNAYNITFCDLERWCTRANNLRLDDTFVMRHNTMDITHLPSTAASTNSASVSSHSSSLLIQMRRIQQCNDSALHHHIELKPKY